MDVNFVWENKNEVDSNDIVSVDLLIAKARGIFSDPFSDIEENKSLLDSHQMRRATESDTLLYSVTVHDLPLGVYHYMFKITTIHKSWLEIRATEKQTTLGSGRKVNYIELTDISPKSVTSFSDCLPQPDENAPLLEQAKLKQKNPKKKKKRLCSLCCSA